MFELVTIQDSIKLPPATFGQDQIEALTEEIDKKYSNKIIFLQNSKNLTINDCIEKLLIMEKEHH